MSKVDRKETEVRRLLDTPHPPVPPSLAERCAHRGRRILRRRRLVRWGFWILAAAVLVGLAVWAGLTDAWVGSPDTTTPDFTG
ncbi:hypothetical protein ACFQLX_03735 [Streptomyces polyrhachis]|uniref:Uncharacterized protein n=1 Tax=Streptomyces polyrhachis TaxID=1282885 RepID=A0ABW2G952_9ACTN